MSYISNPNLKTTSYTPPQGRLPTEAELVGVRTKLPAGNPWRDTDHGYIFSQEEMDDIFPSKNAKTISNTGFGGARSNSMQNYGANTLKVIQSPANSLVQFAQTDPGYQQSLKSGKNIDAIDKLYQKSLTLAPNSSPNSAITIMSDAIDRKQRPGETLEQMKQRKNAMPKSIYDNDSNNQDKMEHFFTSAQITNRLDKGTAEVLGQGHEILNGGLKEVGVSPSSGGTGYDHGDIKANNYGQMFGDKLKKNPTTMPSDVLKTQIKSNYIDDEINKLQYMF